MSEVWTIGRILAWSKDYLNAKNCPSARLDAEVLISDALSCNRVQLYTGFDKPLTDEEKVSIRERLLRRAEHEPVAYITGRKEFYGRTFLVDHSTLIPRPDTELLVEQSIEFIKSRNCDHKIKILDVGAGSGCIGLTLAAEFPELEVELLEINSGAVAILEENVQQLNLKNISEIYCANIFDFNLPAEEYDLIVSNPPYIAEDEKGVMSREVLEFEPVQALFAENQGFKFYQYFAANFARNLKQGGKLLVEIGYKQKQEVESIFVSSSLWNTPITFCDLSGHDRVMMIERL